MSRSGGSSSISASSSTSGRTCGLRACSRASPARSQDAGRRTSTCSSCARTPRASTRAWGAGARTLPREVGDRDERLHARRRRAGRCATRSSRPSRVAASSRARRSRTRPASATCSGTRWRRRSPRSIPGVRYERVLVDALAARMVRDPGQPRRRRRLEPVRGHPHRPRRSDPGRDGHGGEREPRSRHRHAGALRAGARLRAGHRGSGNRESGRRDLERDAAARPPRRGARPRPR